MSSSRTTTATKNANPSARTAAKRTEAAVFGHPDHATLAAIDQVAEQMLMPRSWVVTQILREWTESRVAELQALEESWNGSYREHMARAGAQA
jgi:hypothetical protein